MKFVTLILALAVMAMCSLFTSCTGLITKDDARDLGKVMLKESLAIGVQIANGQDIDPKIAATQLGLKIANMALARATANLGDTPASTEAIAAEADRIVNGALMHATEGIPAEGGSPQETFVAQLVVAGSGDKAHEVIAPPTGFADWALGTAAP